MIYGVMSTGEMKLAGETEFFQETSSTATWTITAPTGNVLECNSGLPFKKLVSGLPKHGNASKSVYASFILQNVQ
jgi:hypothetical protein